MESPLAHKLKERVAEWRVGGYGDTYKETRNILNHVSRIGFLHRPQLEALETYIYLKEVIGNKPTADVFNTLFSGKVEALKALGIPAEEILTVIDDDKRVAELVEEHFGQTDYANQVYALTMGSGKTILMAVFMLYDFVLSFYHPDDKRFAKNALVFAPDTTIIESLKEIKSFDYSKVLPKEYENFLLNLKYHYLEDTETPLTPHGNYNVIVSNSQKIILRTRNIKNDLKFGLFADMKYMAKQEIENKRLYAIRQLKDLTIFVDEAHHSYGVSLEGTLRKTRQTINYLHEDTALTGVVNFTGTPYVNNKTLPDVVYHFGLKQGIETGILKQVRFFDYSNTRSEEFIDDVIEKFWPTYGENRLEGKLPKIAFYAPNIENLREELRPQLERALAKRGINTSKILEYHTQANDNKGDFMALDTPESDKQFVLLVGRGTEGWNCRSLVSCALYRKPTSAIFVLQSSTRCLRSIGDNSTVGTIFLSNENYRILDRELQNNFATNITELQAEEPKTIELEISLQKKRKLTVKKIVSEILAVEQQDWQKKKLDVSRFNPDKYRGYVSTGNIALYGQEALLQHSEIKEEIRLNPTFSYYEIIERINRVTHLPGLTIANILSRIDGSRQDLVDQINKEPAFLAYIIQEILSNAYHYEEKQETVLEEVELTKKYPYRINVRPDKRSLVVYKETLERDGGASRIGFHVDPYNFDSTDERELFKYLREALREDERVVDCYFTGGTTDMSHNDFYVEYYNPEVKRFSLYFPDFLIETSLGRFLVIEVKGNDEKLGYDRDKGRYTGDKEGIESVVFAKEIGFNEFKEINPNFEYRLVFDAGLPHRQQEVAEQVKSLLKTSENVWYILPKHSS